MKVSFLKKIYERKFDIVFTLAIAKAKEKHIRAKG